MRLDIEKYRNTRDEKALVAFGSFTVPAFTFKLLYSFLVVEHGYSLTTWQDSF
jgi:hypothetical protein